MELPEPYDACVCPRMGRGPDLCAGQYTLAEEAKKVRLEPRRGETVASIALDDCVFTDNATKCDGLFLWHRPNAKYAILVELKGAGDLSHAFHQLAFVRYQRDAYDELKQALQQVGGQQPVKERAVIVTNGDMDRPTRERLEREYEVRVMVIRHREPTYPPPDVRDYIR